MPFGQIDGEGKRDYMDRQRDVVIMAIRRQRNTIISDWHQLSPGALNPTKG